MGGCTCGAWMSIIPPPPCPWHTYQPTTTSWTSSIIRYCIGRHCAHDSQCRGPVAMNG